MITSIYLHDPPPFNGPFFMTPPFSESQKVVALPLFPPPSPLLISDKSLICTKGIWRPRAQVNCCRSALTLAGLVLTEFIYSTKLVNDLVCFQPVGILIFYVFFSLSIFFLSLFVSHNENYYVTNH